MKKLIYKLVIIILFYISFSMSCNNKFSYTYPELNIENVYSFSPKKDFYNINDTVNLSFNINKNLTDKCQLIDNIKNGNLYVLGEGFFYIHVNNKDSIAQENEFIEYKNNYVVNFKFIIKKENLDNGSFVIGKNSMSIKWFIEKNCNTCNEKIIINHSLKETQKQ